MWTNWERKLSKSVLDKTHVSKKEENLYRCPLHLRTTRKHNTQALYQLAAWTLDCHCYGNFHTILKNKWHSLSCFSAGHVSYKIPYSFLPSVNEPRDILWAAHTFFLFFQIFYLFFFFFGFLRLFFFSIISVDFLFILTGALPRKSSPVDFFYQSDI